MQISLEVCLKVEKTTTDKIPDFYSHLISFFKEKFIFDRLRRRKYIIKYLN
jgi:hypothetical protein